MEQVIESSLNLLGLDKKQIEFLIANYQLGPATVGQIAKSAKLERSTAYVIFDQLVAKNLLIPDLQAYRKLIHPVEPKKILVMVAAAQRRLRRQEIELEEKLPELEAIYNQSQILPKVRVFNGKDGLLQIYEDILKDKQEILLWTNQQTETKFFDPKFHDKFIAERVRKDIPVRVLAVDNEKGRLLLKNESNFLRQTRLLPKDITFSAETYIYGNRIGILDFHQDILGIIIESEPVASAQRAMFEMAWGKVALHNL